MQDKALYLFIFIYFFIIINGKDMMKILSILLFFDRQIQIAT